MNEVTPADLAAIRELMVPFPVCKEPHTIDLIDGVVYFKHAEDGVCMMMPKDVYEDILKWKETA